MSLPWAQHLPLHRRPQELLTLQHLNDELAPLLLHIVGVVALGQLDSSKFNPNLGENTSRMAFLTSSLSWLGITAREEGLCLCSCSMLLAALFILRVIPTSPFQNKPELSTV